MKPIVLLLTGIFLIRRSTRAGSTVRGLPFSFAGFPSKRGVRQSGWSLPLQRLRLDERWTLFPTPLRGTAPAPDRVDRCYRPTQHRRRSGLWHAICQEMGRGRFFSPTEILLGLKLAGEGGPGHRLAGRRRVHGLQTAVRRQQDLN